MYPFKKNEYLTQTYLFQNEYFLLLCMIKMKNIWLLRKQ